MGQCKVLPKGKKKDNAQSDIICANCNKQGHRQPDCYSKGGGKEGQGLWQRQKAKEKESETAVVAADDEENELFAFTCMSDYVAMADGLNVLKSRLGTCIDSSASRDYCPDCIKFLNYKEIKQKITTADGQTLSAVGMGGLHIELPDGSEKMKTIFKNAIHAPEMAFVLEVTVSRYCCLCHIFSSFIIMYQWYVCKRLFTCFLCSLLVCTCLPSYRAHDFSCR